MKENIKKNDQHAVSGGVNEFNNPFYNSENPFYNPENPFYNPYYNA